MISFVEKIPTVEEYNYLTNSVGWGCEDSSIVEEALNNTLYSVCAYDDEKIIGYGRLIGDNVLFLYIQDVMVIPEYQKQKIGSRILEYILKEVKEKKQKSPNIRTYLGASKGKEKFYEKFGFVSRRDADLGEGMVLF